MNHIIAITKPHATSDLQELTWNEDPEWEIGEQLDWGVEVLRTDGSNDGWLYHGCRQSKLYDDYDPTVIDAISSEEGLSDNTLYMVCYYQCVKRSELWHKVDFGITKQQIIDNVNAQKYVEGATYIPMNLMVKF